MDPPSISKPSINKPGINNPGSRSIDSRPVATRTLGAAPVGRLVPGYAIEHQAWFDLNGDGRIEDTPSLAGGDGYLIGDGNGDGHVTRQLSHLPMLTRSRQAPADETATVAPAALSAVRVDAARVKHAQAAYRAFSG